MRLLFLSLFLSALLSCHQPAGKSYFTITTYNAYAFFDAYDDGTEFDGFSHHDGYDGEAYYTRIRETAVLLGKYYSSSDVIILEEVESIAVLEDLLEAGLKEKGFLYYGLAEPREKGNLAVGFISRKEPLSAEIHAVDDSRPFLELAFSFSGEIIHIFGVHFTSHVDGGEEKRYQEALFLRELMDGCDGLAVAAGDFNADPRQGELCISIFPDNYTTAAIHVTGDPSQMGDGIYYSPLLDPDLETGEKGTYCYENEWYLYDGLLLSSEAWDGEGAEYDSVSLAVPVIMKDKTGKPLKYDVSLGYGYSDHFLVSVTLCSDGQ